MNVDSWDTTIHYVEKDRDELDLLWSKLVQDKDYTWVVLSNMLEDGVDDIIYFGVKSRIRSMILSVEEN